MKRVIAFVKAMTSSMTFDENMASANWPKNRRRNNLFYRLMPKQKGVKYKKVGIGNKGALLTSPKNPDDSCVLVYMHGGGFVTGNAFVCKSYSSALATFTSHRVYAVEYSLAPEYPFPYAWNDAVAAVDEIISLYPDSKLVFVGESAGGNLSLALAHKYKDSGRVACVVVHSPTVDFSGSTNRNLNVNKDFIVKHGCRKALYGMYVGDNDPKNPYISPLHGDFEGFPPVFITADANETLYADSVALYEKCEAAGVKASLIEGVGGYHAYGVSGCSAPETKQILVETAEFIAANLKQE